MQSRHIKANIVAAIAICTGSLGVSVFLIKLSEIDLSGRPVASDRRVALQLSKSRSDPALVFQELKIAQSAPLFRPDRTQFVAPTTIPSQEQILPPVLATPQVAAATQESFRLAIPTASPEPLQFTLKGVLLGLAQKRALLISPDKPQGEWYEIGGMLSGWTLEDILPQRVKLKKADQTTDLFLYVDNQHNTIGTP